MPGQLLCGKPMRAYRLNRPRDYDPAPSCGRPAGHRGRCLTAEVYQRELARMRDYTARKRGAA